MEAEKSSTAYVQRSRLSIKNVSNAFLLPFSLFSLPPLPPSPFTLLPIAFLPRHCCHRLMNSSSFFSKHNTIFLFVLLVVVVVVVASNVASATAAAVIIIIVVAVAAVAVLLLLHLKCFIWPFVCFMGLVVTVTALPLHSVTVSIPARTLNASAQQPCFLSLPAPPPSLLSPAPATLSIYVEFDPS